MPLIDFGDATDELKVPLRSPNTGLSLSEEAVFRKSYNKIARERGLNPNPDAPGQKYDYRGAMKAGFGPDAGNGHWPSKFKHDDHPNRYVSWQGGILDTKKEVMHDPKQPMSVFGYGVRQPYESEAAYFKANPHVTGMAAEDGKITLNPFSGLPPEQQMLVAQNEAARLFLRENKVPLNFDVTPEQAQQFVGTAYEKDPEAMKATIAARLLTGDPSAGSPTAAQIEFVSWLQAVMAKRQ